MAELDAADDLYVLDPKEFTAARDALVKSLRAEGRRDEAARVAKLRRPPATAWALNVVARRQGALVEAVLARGADLRDAMERAVAGDATGLRDAQVWERAAVDAATAAAAAHLATAGHNAGDAARQRVAATLRAAVVDGAVAGQLRRGALEADHSAPGFGLDGLAAPGAGSAPAPPRPRPDPVERPASAPADAPADDGAARARRTAAAREAEALEGRAERLRRDADRAGRRAAEIRTAAEEAAAESERQARRAERLRAEADGEERVAARLRADADEAAEEAARLRAAAAAAGAGGP